MGTVSLPPHSPRPSINGFSSLGQNKNENRQASSSPWSINCLNRHVFTKIVPSSQPVSLPSLPVPSSQPVLSPPQAVPSSWPVLSPPWPVPSSWPVPSPSLPITSS